MIKRAANGFVKSYLEATIKELRAAFGVLAAGRVFGS